MVGSIRVLWDSTQTAQVTITGENASWTVNGNPVSFPYTLTTSTTFTPNTNGRFLVSVKLFGIEIADSPDGVRTVELRDSNQFIFAPTPDPASQSAGGSFLNQLSTSFAGKERTRISAEWTLARVQDALTSSLAAGSSLGSWSAASAATSIAGGVDVLTITGGSPNTAAFRFLRGNTVQRGTTYPASTSIYTTGISYPNDARTVEAMPMVQFGHKGATKFEVVVYGRGAFQTRLRVRVDGKWISATPLDGPANDGQLHRLAVTLPDTSWHEIALEFSGYTCWFYAVTRDPAATIKPLTRPVGPRLVIVGDSQTEGQNGVANYGVGNPLGYAYWLSGLLGLDDTLVSGVGSTGWLSTATGTRYKVRDRLQSDVIDQAPRWVHFAMGQNDVGFTYDAVKTEVLYAIDTIKAALPNTLITMQSQFHPTSGNGLTVSRDAIRDACAARSVLDCNTVPFLDLTAWLTGTGYQTAEVGDGNKDVYVSSDGSHLTDRGHAVASRKVASWMQQFLPTFQVWPHTQ